MEIHNSQFTIHNSALIAMSGGVDSTVAAMLTLREGIECAGATMMLHQSIGGGAEDARRAAEQLGIPLFVLDFSDCFAEKVIDRFISVYSEGRTPNPCVECNRHLKFGQFMRKARELGKDCIVTGHYARIDHDGSGRYLLKKGADISKDQSYVLYTLSQEQLAATRFPLGGLSKTEVRGYAISTGIFNADKRESQDICFVPDGNYSKFIQEYTGQQPRKRRFIDFEGNDLGENQGGIRYTVGQRRGLGLAMPYPPYVLEIRPEDNTVVIGKDEMLYSKTLIANNINLIPFNKLEAPIRACVKIRYRHTEQPALIHQTGDDMLRIEFDEPQRATTKGQSAVIYDGEIVIGGGTIV